MATEPERPIEKLLRAWAKKRRKEASPPLELHPATRRMLQGEVARRFARREGRLASLFQRLRLPQIGFAEALVVIALTVVLGALFLPPRAKSKNEALLALSEKSAPAKRQLAAVNEPAPALAGIPLARLEATGTTLFASADTDQSQTALAAGRLQIRQDEAAKDRELATAGKKVPQTVTFAARAPADHMGVLDGVQPTAPEVPPRAAPAPTPDSSIGLGYKYSTGHAGVSVALLPPTVGGSPSAPGATVAAVENKGAQSTFKSLNGDTGQLAFGNNALGGRVSQTSPTVAFADTKQAGEAVLADKAKSSESMARAGQPGSWGGFQVAPGKTEEAAVAQRFAQVPLALEKTHSALKTPAAPVLVSFQVQQAGRELRIVDSDGSVYSGPIDLSGTIARRRAARPEAATAVTASSAASRSYGSAPAPEEVRPAAQNYFFRVSGMNRSLQQNVVFTGNIITLTNAVTLEQMKAAPGTGTGGRQAAPSEQGTAPLLNSRISGKVVIGNAKPTEINAVPTPAPPPGQ